MAKSALKTIRFSPQELKEITGYLRQNPSFESLSSLGRIAVMDFIHDKEVLPLNPVEKASQQRPSFLWDYDLTESQVREILRHSPLRERRWLMARILERAPLDEVFRYLTAVQISRALPELRMDPKVKRHWQEAVDLWTSLRRTS